MTSVMRVRLHPPAMNVEASGVMVERMPASTDCVIWFGANLPILYLDEVVARAVRDGLTVALNDKRLLPVDGAAVPKEGVTA